MAELPLNDAELRAVRAIIRHGATWPRVPAASNLRNATGNDMADACDAALPAPEPEIVVEEHLTNRGTWVVRKGDKYFGMKDWDNYDFTYSRKQAELIAEALRAREKAAKEAT